MSDDSLANKVTMEECSCWSTTSIVLLTVFLVLCILFKIRNPLQFYVKFGIYVFITMAYSTLIIPFALLRPRNSKNIDLVAKQLSFLFKIFEIKIDIDNAKYLQINQPYILICNHQSSLDFLTMMKIWPGNNCTPLAKRELLWSGPFGFAIWLCGITFIDRFNQGKARGTIHKLCEKINQNNMRVWIFPEGTRSPGTELLPFKKGAFHLAVQAQIPIVSVVISSYLKFYSKKEKKFLPGYVKVKVLPPFQTRGMTIDSVNMLTKHLQDTMQKESDLLNKEIGLDEKYFTKKTGNGLVKTDKLEELLQNASISNEQNDDSLKHEIIGKNKIYEENESLNYNNDESLTNDLNNSTSENLANKANSKSLINDDNNNSINDEEEKKNL